MDIKKPVRSSSGKRHLAVRVLAVAAALASLLLVAVATSSASAQTEQPSASRRNCSEDPAIESCRFDSSARADLEELRTLVREQFEPLGGRFVPEDVEIEFVGKARAQKLKSESSDEGTVASSGGEGGRASNAWRALNPRTRNEFELTVPADARSRIDALLERQGETEPTRGRLGRTGGRSPEGPRAPDQFETLSFSGGDDSRVRLQPTNSWPWRTVANMGGCSATFIGPRHIVTAGHCIYSQRDSAWSAGFNVEPGRDAGNVPYRTTMPPQPGETGWYFTPAQWRLAQAPAGGFGQYDFGIVVVPDRLGDVVGNMGYVTLSDASLQSRDHLLRGYPFCEPETGNPPTLRNPERIDEPSPCVQDALYGGDPCTIGTFSATDPDGRNRRATHGCDASAANSGSSLYTYLNGDPVVTMIHTTSTVCRFAGDPPCTSADTHPLVATRLTPEYRGWISYFRSLFP